MARYLMRWINSLQFILLVVKLHAVKATPDGCNSSCANFQSFPGYDVIIDNDCKLSSTLSNSVSGGPGPVQGFYVYASAVVQNYTDRNDNRPSYSNIRVTWKPPSPDEINGLVGYEVKILNEWNGSSMCYLYNLTKAEKGNETYVHDCDTCIRTKSCIKTECESSMEDGYYKIVVTALPKNVHNRQTPSALVTITGPKAVDMEPSKSTVAGCWETDLVVLQSPCSNDSTIIFQTAPDFQYDYYRIFLQPLPTGTLLVDHDYYTSPGSYAIYTSQVVPGMFKYEMRGVGAVCNVGNTCSVTCLQSRSFSFNVLGFSEEHCIVTPSTTSTPDSTGTLGCTDCTSPLPVVFSPAKIIGIVAGLAMGLILIVILVLLIRRNTKKGSNESIIRTKRVLLLYSHDYPGHNKAVNNFALFLHKRCLCDVHIDQWSQSEIKLERANWLPREIQVAEKIILIVSKGAEKKVAYFRSQSGMPSRRETFLDDNFLQGYKTLKERGKLTATDKSGDFPTVIGVRFEYTPGQISIPGVQKTFELMRELEPILKHIHSVKKLPNNFVSSPHDDKMDDSKAKLTTSISNMNHLTKDHPSWFEEYHGFRTEFDERTATSATDSSGVSRNGTIETTSDAPLIPNGQQMAACNGRLKSVPSDHGVIVPPDDISNITDITISIDKINTNYDRSTNI